MARKSPTTWDTKTYKAIPYTPLAWFIDRHAGVNNGNAAIPDLPVGSSDPQPATTPYLEIRWRHFLDRSELERRHTLNDLDPVYRQLATIRQDIADGEEKVAEIRTRLDAIPEKPDEIALTRRNAAEQHLPGELVRAEYSMDDIRREFGTIKPCAPLCTVGCAHRVAVLDNWRRPARSSRPRPRFRSVEPRD